MGFMMTLGQRLRKLRGKISQGQLAAYSGVSQSTISDIENDKIKPKTIEAIIRLARYHHKTTDYLLGVNEDTDIESAFEDTAEHLIKTIRQLPKHRQRDLLAMAEMFLARKEKDDILALDTVLNRVREVGGSEAENLINDLVDRLDLRRLFGNSDGISNQ